MHKNHSVPEGTLLPPILISNIPNVNYIRKTLSRLENHEINLFCSNKMLDKRSNKEKLNYL